jgi:hypothetical protein
VTLGKTLNPYCSYTVPCKSIHAPWQFSYYFALQPVILNGFLLGFHVMDIHKIDQTGEVKFKKRFG